MSTGAPPFVADPAPLAASNGHVHSHSRGRGHNRSRYAQPPPLPSFADTNVNGSYTSDASNTANGNYTYGHASQHSIPYQQPTHSHAHSHSHSHSYSHSHSHANAHSASHNHGHDHDHDHDHHDHDHAHNHSIASVHDVLHDHDIKSAASQTQKGPEQLNELLAGILIALPWIALSWYPRKCAEACQSPSAAAKNGGFGIGHTGQRVGVLAAFTLIIFGGVQILRKNQTGGSSSSFKLPAPTAKNAQTAFLQVVSVGMPIYAVLKVGGFLVAFALLLAAATGIPSFMQAETRTGSEKYSRKACTIGLLVCVVAASYFGLNKPWDSSPALGYLALLISTLVLSPPFPSHRHQGPIPEPGLVAESISKAKSAATNKSAIVVTADAPLAFVSGAALLVLTTILSQSLPFEFSDLLYILVPTGLIAASLMFSSAAALRSAEKHGLAVGSAIAALLCSPHIADEYLPAYGVRGAMALLSFFASRVDDGHLRLEAHSHNHSHHAHSNAPESTTAVTKWLVQRSEAYPLLHSILKEKDSRSIFYFMCLNFAFMLVQLSYGFLTGSLGLLSDSIHMFFDCLALVVGLCAAVMSKWPPSARFPYGYGKVDTLSGFANGIFLMIISVEIIYEAVERLSTGSEMNRIGELLAVSFAGLLVNLVGIFSFDHAHHHHGHDHGHDHSHGNENMHGIFLHILADTLGSVAVVISTILVHYSGWAGYDPLASCFIAILIFASAVPLVTSTAKTLLLALPGDTEYNVRETLAGVSTLRGVVGYTVPKFWLDDTGSSASHSHDHDHSHDHAGHGGCDHKHDHDHAHSHAHSHAHDHAHDHSHDHDHGHSHEQKSQKVFGVIHVIASRGSDLEDVRQRTVDYLKDKDMDIVVQVERDGEGRCWCGGGSKTS